MTVCFSVTSFGTDINFGAVLLTYIFRISKATEETFHYLTRKTPYGLFGNTFFYLKKYCYFLTSTSSFLLTTKIPSIYGLLK